jgi:prepilin peptidase CpaA
MTIVRPSLTVDICVTATQVARERMASHMNDFAVSLLDALTKLATDPRAASLVTLLVIAGVIDVRTYRIPNWLTVGGACVALGLAILLPSSTHPGFLGAAGGLATGFAIMLPLYALRVMGAGDVKLMAMAGAFLGVPDTFYAVLCAFIAGGVAALVFAVAHKASKRMAANLRDMVESLAFAAMAGQAPGPGMAKAASVGRLPYAICIGIGTIAYVVIKQVGLA